MYTFGDFFLSYYNIIWKQAYHLEGLLSGFQMDLPLIQLIRTGEHQEQTLSHIPSWLLEHKYFRT